MFDLQHDLIGRKGHEDSKSIVLDYALSTYQSFRQRFRAGSGNDCEPGANMATMKFVTVPPLPSCATASVPSGDPTKGPSFILAKGTEGCIFPWHWHTTNEHLMMVSGEASLQMKDGKVVTLRSGAFALMPAHHVHQFKCLSACVLYVYSDTAFDMHYVDKQGSEISPADALKPFREKPATEMK